MSPQIEVIGHEGLVTVGVAIIEELNKIGAIQPITQEQLDKANAAVTEEHAKIAWDHGLGKK